MSYVLLVFTRRDLVMGLARRALQTLTLKSGAPVVNAMLVTQGRTTANAYSVSRANTKTFQAASLVIAVF